MPAPPRQGALCWESRDDDGSMSADILVQGVTQAIFLLIAGVTGAEAARRPRRGSVEIALFFGAAALVIVVGTGAAAIGVQSPRPVVALTSSLIMALPYFLLRLLDDFAGVSRLVMWMAEAGLVLSVLALYALVSPLPTAVLVLLVLYFLVIEVYCAVMFVREASRSTGVTRRRMEAIAGGSWLLGLTILASSLQAVLPAGSGVLAPVGRVAALVAGIRYFIGFAPPAVLRRAWQEPELRAFLSHAASLPHLPDTGAIMQALEHDVSSALGGAPATIALWDEADGTLRFRRSGRPDRLVAPREMIAGQSFADQRPMLSLDTARDDPAHAAEYQAVAARAALSAPITAGDRRLGVLTVYSARPPLFAEDDLTLLKLLAHQAAVVLDYARLYEDAHVRAEQIQTLYQEAQRTQAEREQRLREQAARLEAEAAVRARDEFLSIAAHELKTPVTSLRGFTQLLLRQVDGAKGVDPARLRRSLTVIDQQSDKIGRLVAQMLDLSRIDVGKLSVDPLPTDIVPLVRSVVDVAQRASNRHQLHLSTPGDAVVMVDPLRLEQVLVNLIDNAIKFSPDGGPVEIDIAGAEPARVQLVVGDRGVGIPADRRERVFERFFQAHAEGYLSGMGLGLYIARQIVEAHNGQITVEARPEGGSRFVVTLPAAATVAAAAGRS